MTNLDGGERVDIEHWKEREEPRLFGSAWRMGVLAAVSQREQDGDS